MAWRPYLAVVRSLEDGGKRPGLIHEEDVLDDGHIRVFGSSAEARHLLTMRRSPPELDLPVLDRSESLERTFADGWQAG
jgi:hypothetical protein